MKPPTRALLSSGLWAAFLATGAAQLELKREPLPPPARVAPAPVIIRGPNRVIIGNGGIIINGINAGNQLNVAFGSEFTMEPAKTAPDPAGNHVLEYSDGQRLHGTLTAIDGARGEIVWQRPDASAPIAIPYAQISRWSSEKAPAPATPEAAAPTATVKFSGGDWLAANVTAIQGDKVQLQLPDGTRLTTSRAHLEWIYFSKNGAVETYDGPTSLAGWASAGNWAYREGALYASSPNPISRTFQSLPDQVEYRLMVNQGEITNAFTISLHTRNIVRGMNRGMIQLMLRASTLNLWASIDGNFKSVQTDIGQHINDPGRAKELFIRVFEDVTKGRLLVYINGRKAAEWSIDKGEPGKNGGNFQFQPTSWSGEKEQSISSIRILPWDGLDPEKNEDRSLDRVSLGSGEAKTGKLTSWDGRVLKLTTEDGAVTVPASQISLLRFQRPENPPDDQPPMAHLRLAGRGEFDVVALNWRDGKFQARTNFGGELTLPPSAIAELAFNRPLKSSPSEEDLLVFRNGDRLHGALETVNEAGQLRWRPNPAGPVIEFAPTNVSGVQFATRTLGVPRGAVARFRNGDWLAGQFVTLDREQLVLDTADAGQLIFPRTGVNALYFNASGAPAISDGVSDHAIWERGLDFTTGNSALRKKLTDAGSPWSYFAGAFSRTRMSGNDDAYNRSGGIQLGRTFETLDNRVDFNFTFSSERPPVFFSMQLFTDPTNPGYMLTVSTNVMVLYDMNPRARVRGAMQQQFQFGKDIDPNARKRQFRVLADRTSGRMTILVDGVVTAQINPRASDGPRNLGRGIMISPQQNVAITISDLWIGPWNGVVPGKTPAPQPAPSTIGLANGDEVQGTIELATPTTMKVASDVGPLDLPVERLTMVDFGGPPIERRPGTRLHLTGQGTVTVTAWRIENEMIIGQSEVAGELKVPLKAVQEIVFAEPAPAKTPE